MVVRRATNNKKSSGLHFEAVKIDSLFEVLDAVAWLDSPTTGQIAQYADIDPRTAGKVLKNARLVGLVQSHDGASSYVLAQPYPYKGTLEEKRNVVREALLKHPLIRSIRRFMALGDDLPDAMRKAATVAGEKNYDQSAIAPLVTWASSEGALGPEGSRRGPRKRSCPREGSASPSARTRASCLHLAQHEGQTVRAEARS
jgi:hypothetical protein